MTRIAVLVACYNRKALTLNVLRQLKSTEEICTDTHFQVFLLDDASTDGTHDAVRVQFPSVKVLRGTGQLYWNRGMCAAYKAAAASNDWHAFMLLNDDLSFNPEDLVSFVTAYHDNNRLTPTILVGAVSSVDGKLLYSGMRRKNFWRTAPAIVAPDPHRFLELDTMNGNLVLVPGKLMRRLGGLDPVFHHGFGDIDLGYRARKLGGRILLYPRVVGSAPQNLPFKEKLAKLNKRERLNLLFASPHDLGQYAWVRVATRPKNSVPHIHIQFVCQKALYSTLD